MVARKAKPAIRDRRGAPSDVAVLDGLGRATESFQLNSRSVERRHLVFCHNDVFVLSPFQPSDHPLDLEVLCLAE